MRKKKSSYFSHSKDSLAEILKFDFQFGLRLSLRFSQSLFAVRLFVSSFALLINFYDDSRPVPIPSLGSSLIASGSSLGCTKIPICWVGDFASYSLLYVCAALCNPCHADFLLSLFHSLCLGPPLYGPCSRLRPCLLLILFQLCWLYCPTIQSACFDMSIFRRLTPILPHLIAPTHSLLSLRGFARAVKYA